jgi:ABC-type nitrate/sulfonate/bicarbonate transport system permease component
MMLRINSEKYYLLIGPLIVLIVWLIFSNIIIVSRTLLPTIDSTFEKVYELLITGVIFPNLDL